MSEPALSQVARQVDRWAAAERAGDQDALDAVLHGDFLFAGPYGYLLDRRDWIARFTPGDPKYTRFTAFTFTADVPTRVVGDTALVIGTQRQSGVFQGDDITGHHRGTVVLVRVVADAPWLIVGLHLSLPEPPEPAPS